MIIASALRKVFEGMTLEVTDDNGVTEQREVQFHYGDQKELLLWIKNRGNMEKYPLIWYVLNRYNEINGKFTTDARIVLMQVTKIDKMNVWRSENTYLNVLQPLSNEVQKIIGKHKFISVIGNPYDRFNQRDEPKYGLPRNNDESTGANKSIATDFVDAKILTFKMEIQPYCII